MPEGRSQSTRMWSVILRFAVLLVLALGAEARAARTLALCSPNGGESFETGQTLEIWWWAMPPEEWYGTDSVRLEYSSDSGATWERIPGSPDMWVYYNSSTYLWDTSGLPEKDTYRVRVVFLSDETLADASDADFSIRDESPPVIAHTPLTDTPRLANPYRVSATIKDPGGVRSASVIWNLNGGPWATLPMAADSADRFYADIPGEAQIGDRIFYSIEAVDGSPRGNAARSPAAPEDSYCFSTVACASDTLGGGVRQTHPGTLLLNFYYCDTESELTQIENYPCVRCESNLSFVVYECDAQVGYYSSIFTKTLTNWCGGWANSGPISVTLKSGRYYAIGVYVTAQPDYDYLGPSGQGVSFGVNVGSRRYSAAALPGGWTCTFQNAETVSQRLTSCRHPRAISLTSPAGGSRIEPGQEIVVGWWGSGVTWAASDTVSVEYSPDGGATWHLAPGGESHPYATGELRWTSAGYPESEHYRVRVTVNSDPGIFAESGDFSVRLDREGPVITHTPLTDTHLIATSYKVLASVTDSDMGMSPTGVRLFWRRNGGEFASAQMNPAGGPYFSGNTGAAAAVGDVFDYYIEATDRSIAANTAREPASGWHSFTIQAVPDFFTEAFYAGGFDLANYSVRFTPDGSYGFYSACLSPIAGLPTDPGGGNVLPGTANGSMQVALTEGKTVKLYGRDYDSLFVSMNGCVTFGAVDSAAKFSITDHFSQPRISGLLADLDPAAGGSVSSKQLPDRLAVTWLNVPRGFSGGSNTFQIELFYDGTIALSYLSCDAPSAIAGLSAGGGAPPSFTASDLSANPLCCPAELVVTDSAGAAGDLAMDFGVVAVGAAADGQVTMANTGACALRIGALELARYVEDFEDGLAQGWQLYPAGGVWQVQDGIFYARQANPTTEGMAASLPGTMSNIYFEASMRSPTLSQGFEAFLAVGASEDFAPDAGSAYLVGINDYGSYRFVRQVNGVRTTLKTGYTRGILNGPGLWNTIGVNASGSTIEMYANGTYITSVEANDFAAGRVGLCVPPYGAAVLARQAAFDDVTIADARAIGGAGADPARCGGYRLLNRPPVPLVIAQGQSVPLDILFAPQEMGTDAALLRIVSSEGAAAVALSGTGRLAGRTSEPKALPDGASVCMGSNVVSAVFPGRFYVQAPDRSGGIGVLWSGEMPLLGSSPDIDGAMSRDGQERVVVATSVVQQPGPGAPVPLAMRNWSVGGEDTEGASASAGQKGVTGGAGLNNIGLLLRTSGRVLEAYPDGFSLSDGCLFGTPSGPWPVSVRVLCPPEAVPPAGAFAVVTGISSCWGETEPVRLIRVPDASGVASH